MGDPLVSSCRSRSRAPLPGILAGAESPDATPPARSLHGPVRANAIPGVPQEPIAPAPRCRPACGAPRRPVRGPGSMAVRTDSLPRAACTGSVEEGGTRGLRRGGGGESGIRTHGRVSPTHAFQACSFNRSDISPGTKLARSRAQSITGVSAPCAPSAGGPGRWIGPGPPAGGGAPDGLIGPGADDRLNLPPADRGGRPPSRTSAGRSAARTLCNFSLRTASGPEGSSAK